MRRVKQAYMSVVRPPRPRRRGSCWKSCGRRRRRPRRPLDRLPAPMRDNEQIFSACNHTQIGSKNESIVPECCEEREKRWRSLALGGTKLAPHFGTLIDTDRRVQQPARGSNWRPSSSKRSGMASTNRPAFQRDLHCFLEIPHSPLNDSFRSWE